VRTQGGASVGYRRLIGLGAGLAVLLLVGVTLSWSSAQRRAELSEQRQSAVSVAERATRLRFQANDLFGWQVASMMGVLERRPAAFDPASPTRRQYLHGLEQLTDGLDGLRAAQLSAEARARLDAAALAVADLRASDAAMAADYSSGQPARVRAAAEQATTVQIDRFQAAATTLSELATVTGQRAASARGAAADAARQARAMLIGFTVAMLGMLAVVVGWVWRGDRRQSIELHRLFEEANLDPLTGLANRRVWDQALEVLAGPEAPRGPAVTIVLIDLDHFKQFNDRFGHPAGDRHLRSVGEILLGAVRRDDLVARVGGEEFGLLLRGSTAADGVRVVERIRPAVPDGQTLSAGVAQWDRREPPAELVARADRVLYEAKASGRDRLAVAATGERRSRSPRPVLAAAGATTAGRRAGEDAVASTAGDSARQ
jgi:diguanylate cyclase (GGDEF)-like protein